MNPMKFFELLKLFVAVLFVGCFSSCGDNNETPVHNEEEKEEAIIACSVDNIVLNSDGGIETFSFSVNQDWSIKVLGNVTWCTVSSSLGKAGTHSVNISVEKNSTNIERNVSLAILCGDKSHTIVVSQKQRDAFILSSEKIEVASNGGQVEIGVKTNVDYEIEIVGDAAQWIKKVTTRSMASYSHVFSIESNEKTNLRQGIIHFKTSEKTYPVVVYQEGVSNEPILILDVNERVVGASGETIAVEIKSNVDFGVKMPDVDWIKTMENARSLSSHTLRYIVLPNETYDERKAEIVIYDKNSDLKETFRIVQKQQNALLLMKNEVEMEQKGGEFLIDVKANVEYRIEIPQAAKNWLQIVESRALNTYSHKFIVSSNEAYEDRSVKVVFSDLKGTINDVLVVKQKQKDLLQVSKNRYEVNAKKDTIEVEVEANIDFEVQINVDWITLIKQTSISSVKQMLHFEIDENLMTQERNGSILIVNKEKVMEQTISVLQRMKGQDSSDDKEPEGNVDDMIWG